MTIARLLPLSCALWLVAACSEPTGDDSGPPVASAQVAPDSLNVFVGDTFALTVTARDSAGHLLAGRSVMWRSEDSTVVRTHRAEAATGATGSAAATLVAAGIGRVRVTATAGGISDSSTVVVSPGVRAVALAVHQAAMAQSDSLLLLATVSDTAGNLLTAVDVEWTSSDTAIAQVREVPAPASAPSAKAAMVSTRYRIATVRIVAKVHGDADTCVVTVVAAQYCQLWLAMPAASGMVGDTLSARVLVTYCSPECQLNNCTTRSPSFELPTPQPGVSVLWTVASGGGRVVQETTLTNAEGYASTPWILGPEPGRQTTTARVVRPESLIVAAYAVVDTTPQIALVRPGSDGGGSDIYLLRLADRALLRLTSAPGADDGPSWSPAGDQLAFVSSRDGNRELYVMDADGSSQTRLTQTVEQEASPAWSPDGRWIAVSSDSGRIRLVAPDGSRDTTLTPAGAHHYQPSWAPDGARLAVRSAEFQTTGTSWIEILGLDGTRTALGATAIATEGSWDLDAVMSPAWSPDGSRIAYTAFDYQFNRFTGSDDYRYYVRVVTPAGALVAPALVEGRSPSWTPDGSQVVFVSARKARTCGPAALDDGNLTLTPPDFSTRVRVMPSLVTSADPPRWRPRPH